MEQGIKQRQKLFLYNLRKKKNSEYFSKSRSKIFLTISLIKGKFLMKKQDSKEKEARILKSEYSFAQIIEKIQSEYWQLSKSYQVNTGRVIIDPELNKLRELIVILDQMIHCYLIQEDSKLSTETKTSGNNQGNFEKLIKNIISNGFYTFMLDMLVDSEMIDSPMKFCIGSILVKVHFVDDKETVSYLLSDFVLNKLKLAVIESNNSGMFNELLCSVGNLIAFYSERRDLIADHSISDCLFEKIRFFLEGDPQFFKGSGVYYFISNYYLTGKQFSNLGYEISMTLLILYFNNVMDYNINNDLFHLNIQLLDFLISKGDSWGISEYLVCSDFQEMMKYLIKQSNHLK